MPRRPDFPAFCQRIGLPLEPFQRRIAAAVRSSPEALILLPRGGGKTTLLAALALHELVTVERPAVYVAAASREQAAILYEAAAGFARRLDHPHVVPRHLELRYVDDPAVPKVASGHLRVLASDAPKAHGLTPSLAIIDELHAHRDAELYIALRTAMSKRPGSRLVTISTAAQGAETPLGRLRARALALPKVTRRGALTDARGPGLRMLEWAVPDDADWRDLRWAKRANPASWTTRDALRAQRDALPESAYRRYHLNQWVAREGALFEPGRWQATAGQPHIDPDGRPLIIAIDMGKNRSATGVCWVQWHDNVLHAQVEEIDAPNAPAEVDALIDQLAREHALQEVCADPWHVIGALSDAWEARGLTVVEVPQHDARMVPAFAALTELVNTGRLVRPAHPALERAVENSVQVNTRRGARIGKVGEQRNDVLIALAIAAYRATAPARPPLELVAIV